MAIVDKSVDDGSCATEASSFALVGTAVVASTIGDGCCTGDVTVWLASANAVVDETRTIAEDGRGRIERVLAQP